MWHTRISLQNFQPELHRYAQSTFHDGSHRSAPGDYTPWRDVSSPVNRFRAWWLAPAAKGSIIAAWCVTLVFGTYCFSIQQDAKGTYLLNNVLMRSLHDETQRADANEDRAAQLQDAMRKRMKKETFGAQGAGAKFHISSMDSGNTAEMSLVNYELELARAKSYGELVHERNLSLVKELKSLRAEMCQIKKHNARLLSEVDKMAKLTRSRMSE